MCNDDGPCRDCSPKQFRMIFFEGPTDEALKKKIDAQNCQKFSYKTLCQATNRFASRNKLGQGGYGLVYKGELDDGKEIAVKVPLNLSTQHEEQLIKEIELLSSVKHPNVVKLFGYCTNKKKILLVYEYVPNKSLNMLLFGPNRRDQELDWSRTYNIIVGIARGLSYLHINPQNCIIHRDIKPENILLDHKWVPKISDFGLSRLFEEDQTSVYTDTIAGTRGYVAPEHLISVKTDVYSFGVLVLELISGKRSSSFMPPEGSAICLLDWAYKLYEENRILEIMDPALANSAVTEQVIKCIKMGLRCVQGDPDLRPDMERCLSKLTCCDQDHNEASICEPGTLGYGRHQSVSLSTFEGAEHEASNNLEDISGDEYEGEDS
ncbi:cysteine-rich receptor-like protein kinase 43 [Prosopis cineraria]|uniref:cysteine-rich receptor-like protein kinase 43 n=1 Tax=Prosopis cineraria TaxID=364024 RepID=UPI002410431B|nr:cysteine-rich receptor-like protein kinase 43 [Prosopis cineraria]